MKQLIPTCPSCELPMDFGDFHGKNADIEGYYCTDEDCDRPEYSYFKENESNIYTITHTRRDGPYTWAVPFWFHTEEKAQIWIDTKSQAWVDTQKESAWDREDDDFNVFDIIELEEAKE